MSYLFECVSPRARRAKRKAKASSTSQLQPKISQNDVTKDAVTSDDDEAYVKTPEVTRAAKSDVNSSGRDANGPLVIVDGVYSLRGAIADLPRILEVTHKHGALLMVDEAHALGAIGPGGRGTAAHFGLNGKVDIPVPCHQNNGKFGIDLECSPH